MHAVTAIDHLWQILALAMIEAERKLVRKYLRTAEIHPNQ
ncbi:MAG: hypothetical protein BWY76_00045 [bacterium ADurb.Bin429]|nr:MAG: hypothetical protein BWY76_00045 [bacterium ADurb.Bin429]